jgi:hypothetical protein
VTVDEAESGKTTIASEVSVAAEEDHDEAGILPFRRTVSV